MFYLIIKNFDYKLLTVDIILLFCYYKRIGEWLNGRVVVSKTIGCVFESRLPCQILKQIAFFCCTDFSFQII